MKKLAELLVKVRTITVQGDIGIGISQVAFDSRKVTLGTLFVAMKGTHTDGHQYIQQAIIQGAAAVICEKIPANTDLQKVAIIQVQDSSIALGIVAANYYDNPSSQLKVIAVTGTNGKTTHVTLLYNLFKTLGYKCGLLSTVHNYVNDNLYEATHTTGDALQINHMMHLMNDAGCQYCFMEASSHAIHQNRMAGLSISGALFTNITHDHLDYHLTFDNYIAAKKKLFDELPASAFALINVDDKRGKIMVQNTQATVHTFALKNTAEFKAKLVSNTLQGLAMEMENRQVWFKLIGEFNAYNLLGVYATAVLCGVEKIAALTALSGLNGAKGRFEQVISKQNIIGIVDYAHTPDALENVLTTIAQLRTRQENVITIVGCGGNRDAAKRPVMAAIAGQYSNVVILTSDNPRNEQPEDILLQMEAGIKPQHYNKYKKITDRKEAIFHAVEISNPKDIILLAGKGHEDYQEVMGAKHHFDDQEMLVAAYKYYEK
ncbi:MAG: UDP-N-acetylmuramoyl-L-alanyl-D-glutamate--2,6-diaminopimelate ligase [Cytophagales bacterium]|nr:UDP-N-acetylmuramoyl-L-alanyl-D-glutamate--2,6-diaminopimelate ligase [Cytophagales bacterium]